MPQRVDVKPPTASISRARREQRNGHRGAAILLTGLPAAGKSTLAQALHAELFARGLQSVVLDGDGLRVGLNQDLGFSDSDRQENIRRASELAALLVENGQIVILAMIAPWWSCAMCSPGGSVTIIAKSGAVRPWRCASNVIQKVTMLAPGAAN